MTPYLCVFAISWLLLMVVEHKKKNKVIDSILVGVALILPILLAGMRDVYIGTDTQAYATLTQTALSSNGFFDYLQRSVYINNRYEWVYDREIGYNILTYFSAKITGSLQGMMLITHAIIIILIYKGIKHITDAAPGFPVSFGMLTFYLLYFGSSLNGIRQWLAMAVILFAFQYLVENKNIKFFAFVGIATLFHTSAVLMCAVLWAVYQYMRKKKIRMRIKIKGIDDAAVYKLWFLGLIGLIALSSLPLVGSILSHFGGIFARYVQVYLSGNIRFSLRPIIRKLPIITVLLLSWKKMKKKTEYIPFLYATFILELLTTQLTSVFAQSGRIGYYFALFNMILYPAAIYAQPKKNRIFFEIFIFGYLLTTFLYEYAYMGWNEIIPYVFFFQH